MISSVKHVWYLAGWRTSELKQWQTKQEYSETIARKAWSQTLQQTMKNKILKEN